MALDSGIPAGMTGLEAKMRIAAASNSSAGQANGADMLLAFQCIGPEKGQAQ
jgi:hypothetical protein